MLKKLNIGTSEIEQVEAFNALVEFCNDIGNARWFLEHHEKQIEKLENKLSTLEEQIHPTAKVDPYVESRKWIGTLCKFWSDDRNDCVYGILASVLPGIDQPYEVEDCEDWYEHCEPVKPDDDIIYKGGDNE